MKYRFFSMVRVSTLAVFSVFLSLFLPILGTAPNVNAATVGSGDCTQTVSNTAGVTVSQVGSDCVITFLSDVEWTIPTGVSSVRFLLVGGGASGRPDGGGGGGGGAGLIGTSVPVTAGTTAVVDVGAGGDAIQQLNGSPTQLNLDGVSGFEYVANGGSLGTGWTTGPSGTWAQGGNGGTTANPVPSNTSVQAGGGGGSGPRGNFHEAAVNAGLGNGFQSDITGTTLWYGGGGGGGIGSHSNGNTNQTYGGSLGGFGGGGAGAVQLSTSDKVNSSVSRGYRVDGTNQSSAVSLIAKCNANANLPFSTRGWPGLNGYGGGGGGGTAYGDGCSNGVNVYDDGERTWGGDGGSGVVIVRYTATVTLTLNANGGTPSTSTQQIRVGTATAISANPFTRSGSSFLGWNTQADGTGTSYADQSNITLNASQTLFAIWDVASDLVSEFGSSTFTSTNPTWTAMVGSVNADRTVTGGSGSWSGATTTSPAYAFGNATTELFTTGNFSNTFSGNQISIFTWVYPVGNNHSVIQERNTGVFTTAPTQESTLIEMVNGVYNFRLPGCTPIAAPSPTTLENWHHIGFTFNGTTLRAFINGSQVASGACARSIPTSNLFFGVGGNDGNDMNPNAQAKGNFRLSFLQFYKATLTPQKITDLYNFSTVTYRSNYSGGPSEVKQKVSNGVNSNLNANTFTRPGLSFSRWSNTTIANSTYTNQSQVNLRGNLILNALWATTVTYRAGDFASNPEVVQEKIVDSSLTLMNSGDANTQFTRSGYVVSGWSTNPNGSVTSYQLAASYTGNTALILYPVWMTCDASSGVLQTNLVLHLSAGSCSTTGSSTSWPDISANANTANLTLNPSFSSSRGRFYTFNNGTTNSSTSSGRYGVLTKSIPGFTNGLSVSFFAKFDSTAAATETVLSLGTAAGTTNNLIEIYRQGDNNQLTLRRIDGTTCSATGASTTRWSHYAIVWSSAGECTFYRDGEMIGNPVALGFTGNNNVQRSVVYIGRSVSHNSNFRYFSGSIGDLAIYNGTLSASEVKSNFLSQADAVYTVSYNGNSSTGGTVPTDSSSPYVQDATITVLANSGNLVRNGFTFVGWNTLANGLGTDRNVSSTFTMGTANVELFAMWVAADANLSALALSSGTLSPTFSTNTTSYTASVANSTESITVTPTVTQVGSTVQVKVNNGSFSSVSSGTASQSLPLNVGSNTVEVRVTAQDGSTTVTYTITVTRDVFAALTPTFGTPTATANGFTVQINNYDNAYTWAGTATASGTVSISGSGLVTVTGVASATSSTATITTTRTGYASGSANVSATSLTALSNPSTPTVSATSATLKSIAVSWTAVANASSYTLRIYASNGTTLLETINALSGTSATITSSNFAGIADNTTYQITLTAVGTGNFATSAESNKASATTNPAITVTYNTYGGSSVASETTTVGAVLSSAPTPPTKSGSTFFGWSLTNGGVTINFPFTHNQTENFTLHAIWTAGVISTNLRVNLDASNRNSLAAGSPTTWNSIAPGTSFSSTSRVATFRPDLSPGEVQLVANSFVRFGRQTAATITGSLTVEAWIRLSDTYAVSSTSLEIANHYFDESTGQKTADSMDWYFRIANGRLVLFTSDLNAVESAVFSDIVVNNSFAGKWIHIGFAQATNGQVQFYLNGVPVGSLQSANPRRGSTTARLLIGNGISSFVGSISKFRMYADLLTREQVRSNFEIEAASFGWKQLRSLTINSNSFTSSYTMVNTPPRLTATASAGTGTITFTSGTTVICTVNSSTGQVTFVAPGTCSISAMISDDATYDVATAPSISFTVTRASQTVTWSPNLSIAANSSPATPSSLATALGSATIAYSVQNAGTTGCTVNSSTAVISFSAPGSCTVRATAAQTTSYETGTVDVVFSISSVALSNASTPTAVATTNTLKSIAVSWTAVTNASSYTLRLYASNGTTLLQTLTGLSGTSRTLTASDYSSIADNTTYQVSITAVGTGNFTTSAESGKASVTTNAPAAAPTISTQPSGATRTYGQSITFSVTASVSDSGTVTYQWQKNGTNISGATSNTYTIASVINTDAADYRVVITNSINGTTATTNSNAATLIVNCAPNASLVSSGLVLHLDAGSPCSTGTSGVWRDISGNSRNVTWVNAPTLQNTNGSFYDFNRASSQYGTFTSSGLSDFSTGFSISFYARFDATAGGGWERIVDFGRGDNNENIIVGREGTTNRLILEIRRGSVLTLQCSSASIVDGSWAHYAITVDPTSGCVIYRNGTAQTLVGNIRSATFLPVNIERTLNFVGESNWAADAFFDGGTGEIAIYNRGLTSSEVQTNLLAQAENYTITYEYNSADGGNTTSSSVFIVGGTGITLPTPTRTGFSFGGWFEAANLSGSQLTSPYSPTQSRTIYAKWTQTYVVTYAYNGATGGNSTVSSTFLVGGSAITLPVPTKTGSTFGGWYVSDQFSGSSLGSTYSPAQSITIYARWTEVTGAPSAPRNVQVVNGNQSLVLSWQAPAILSGTTITGYQVQYSTTGTSDWTTASSSIGANTLTYTISGLTVGTSYYTRVAALFSGGRGAYGYPWTEIYRTNQQNRDSNGNIVYATGFGLSGGAASTNSSADFTRIRYRVGATYSSQANYVDADFERSFSKKTTASTTFDSISKLQVPIVTAGSSRFIIHADVTDLTVESNVNTVVNGFELSGRLEIWPMNYSIDAISDFASRASGTYDDSDVPSADGNYGSFQLHKTGSGTQQTVFAWNRHYESLASAAEVGFGNAPSGNSDWTFCSNATCTGRSNFSWSVFVNIPTSVVAQVTAATPTISSQPSNTNKTAGQSLTLSVTASRSDSGTLTYQWQKDGTNISGATSSSYTIANTATTDSGAYRVVVTNTLSTSSVSTNSEAATVTISPALTLTTPTAGLEAVPQNAFTLSISASGGSGGNSFAVASGTLPAGLSLSGNTISGTPTTAGSSAITIRVTDSNSATATTSSFTINVRTACTPASTVNSGGYTVLTFTSSTPCNWIVPTGISAAQVLVVGGGGGGNRGVCSVNYGAGAGGGGVYLGSESLTPGAVNTISVGSGGARATGDCNNTSGQNGGASRFGAIQVNGGVAPAFNSFSGGASGNGNAGGTIGASTNPCGSHVNRCGVGGGGGAGAAGSGFNGGAGVESTISGSRVIYGGGGPGFSNVTAGTIGTAGDLRTTANTPTANTGGGGADWTAGAAGVVIIRYGNQISFTYNLNNGSGSIPTGGSAQVGSNFTTAASTGITRDTFTFTGWNTAANGSGTSFAANTSVTMSLQSGPIILYAQWTATSASNPTINTQPANTNKTAGQSLTLSVSASVTDGGTLSYQWQKDGTNISGATSNTYTIANTSTSDSGAYRVVVTNTLSTFTATTNSDSATVTISSALTIATPSSGLSAKTGTSFSLSISASGGSGSNTFAVASGTLPTGLSLSGNSISGTPTTAGTSAITIRVTDSNSATATTNSFTITVTAVCAPASSTSAGFTVLVFTSTTPCSWTVPSGVSRSQVAVVGGGGGGGFGNNGGGGGAGEVLVTGNVANSSGTATNVTPISLTPEEEITISIGSGGTSGAPNGSTEANASTAWSCCSATSSFGGNGGSTSFGNITALGGGGGGGNNRVNGGNGGSGGGAGSGGTAGQVGTNSTPSGWTSFKNAGTTGGNGNGGGAGGVGQSTRGGSGLVVLGRNVAGGGGGWGRLGALSSLTDTVLGGNGRLATGSWSMAGIAPNYTSAGVNGTGTGGGAGAPGGSGVVIVRYANVVSFTYDANNGTGTAPAGGSVQGGVSFTTAENPFTRDGYTFAGWNTAANGSGTALTANASNTMPTSASSLIFYAQWTPNTYTVTYSYNSATGGNSVVSSTSSTGGTGIALPTPVRAGYTFGGWFAAADFSGTAVTSPYTPTQNQTLYAKWNANTVTVTFFRNDGNDTSSVQTFSADTATALSSNTFTRTGYTFNGWNTLASGTGTNYSDGQSVTLLTALTLYAKWSANTLTITFNRNDGSGTSATQSVTAGTSAALTSNAFTRAGYLFSGWTTASDGSGTAYGNSAVVTIFENLALHAKWTAISYTVRYGINGATGTVPTETNKIIGNTFQIASSSGLTRNGFTFGGWSDGTNTFQAGATYTVGAANVNFVAQWNIETYVVTYDVNSGSGAPTRSSDNYQFGSTAIVLPSQGTLSRTGYTFGGWATTNSGTAIVGGFTPTQSVTLYAVWSPNTYTISYNTNGATGAPSVTSESYTTGNSGTNLASRGTMVKTGHSFGGWSLTANGAAVSAPFTTAQSVTLYAIWSPIGYTITYDLNGGNSALPTQSAKFFNETFTLAAAATRADNTNPVFSWAFVGWFDGTNEYQAGTTYLMPAANVTLSAVWIQVFTVKYTMNGASTPAPADSFQSNGATVTLASAPTRTGYTFTKWKDQSNNLYDAGSSMTVSAGSYLLYAQWTPVNYAVTYSLAGGTNSPGDGSFTIGQEITIGSAPARAGYKFNGWSYGGQLYGPGAKIVGGSANINLTASWTVIDYTVTYDMNGSSNNRPNGLVLNIGQTFQTANAPTRTGYTFAGWSDSSTLTAAGATYTMGANNVNLIASWTAINYTLTYDVNGGSSQAPTGSTTLNIGGTFTIANAPTHANRSFLGWSDGTNTYTAGQSYTVGSSNIVLTAVWSGVNHAITYDLNGGSGIIPTEVARQENDTFVVKDNSGFSRSNHTFNGWKIGTQSVLPSDTVTVGSSPITLTAQWTPSFNVTFDSNGGSSVSTLTFTGTALNKPTNPTKADFVFNGWTNNNVQVTWPYTPTGPVALVAQWIQASLYGLDPSHLTPFGRLISSPGVAGVFTGSNANSSVRVEVPADTLPSGTNVSIDLVNNLSRASNVIPGQNSYLISFVVSWLTPTGTVPRTSGDPIAMTITNPNIKAGATIYSVVGETYTVLGTATQDGSVTLEIREDPEIVVINTKPDAPRNVSALSGGTQQAVISWTAPLSNGGNAITGYTASASNNGPSCTTTTLSCTITGLVSGTAYSFSVTATNTVGTSVASSSVSLTTASTYAVTFNSKGGSAVSNGSFITNGNISAPSDPTKAGFTFVGWSATDGGSAITFPHNPGANADTTLYALWSPNTNLVNFDPKGGSQVNASAFNTGSTVSEPSAPTRDGYTFAGWSATDGGSAITFPYTPSQTSDITLYALWNVVQNQNQGNNNSNNNNSNNNNSNNNSTPPVVTPVQPAGPVITRLNPIQVVGSAAGKVPTIDLPIQSEAKTPAGDVVPTTIKITKENEKFVDSVKVLNNQLAIVPVEGFSGIRTVTVTINQGGADRIFEIPLVVLPEPVRAPVVTPSNSRRTIIDWKDSPNADRYEVFVDGKRVCATAKTECTINQLLGPKSVVEIVPNGGDRTKSEAAPASFDQSQPVQVVRLAGSSRIKPNISASDKAALDRVIELIKRQGFGTVIITNVTTIKSNRSAAEKRLEAIQDYIKENLGKLEINFQIKAPSKKTFINTVSVSE